MRYDELLIEADAHGLVVKEKPLRGNRGRIKGNRIAIKEDLLNDVVGSYTISFDPLNVYEKIY